MSYELKQHWRSIMVCNCVVHFVSIFLFCVPGGHLSTLLVPWTLHLIETRLYFIDVLYCRDEYVDINNGYDMIYINNNC